jgi:predicted GTPase
MHIAVIGAAGRDFHDFLVLYRDDPNVEVVAFTAAQIPGIANRRFPAELAGPRYPNGIPIVLESDLEKLIAEKHVEQVVFAYSDVTNEHIARLAARANAAGADFVLPGSRAMVPSKKPVIGVGAVRTGCGKSQTTRYIQDILCDLQIRAVGIRHPMPYGDLAKQAVQRFATREDLVRHECTIEEREEYEPYVERGRVVYAGVDYAAIVAEAEKEADLILWDGGNNDLPLVRPDFDIVLMDPHRPGHSERYYPSSAQVRMANLILIAKANTASPEAVEAEKATARRLNPTAQIIAVGSSMTLVGHDEADLLGRRVVVVEDGPTTTHGGMGYGAGYLLAKRAGAHIVDPKPFFKGELASTLATYPGIGPLVPAMGYSPKQQADLAATIDAVDAEYVISGTPIDLAGLIKVNKPVLRVAYDLEEMPGEESFRGAVVSWMASKGLIH